MYQCFQCGNKRIKDKCPSCSIQKFKCETCKIIFKTPKKKDVREVPRTGGTIRYKNMCVCPRCEGHHALFELSLFKTWKRPNKQYPYAK